MSRSLNIGSQAAFSMGESRTQAFYFCLHKPPQLEHFRHGFARPVSIFNMFSYFMNDILFSQAQRN